jgi:hypothetical protein
MSAKYPDCPLFDHRNCRDCENPNICAIVREDRCCLKSRLTAAKKTRRLKCEPINSAKEAVGSSAEASAAE